MPSKSRFVMKFTTPATASAPYTDEAPPVIVSTRAMAADGIVLMLTAIEALIGIARRPSSSTKFRFGPRPRRLKRGRARRSLAIRARRNVRDTAHRTVKPRARTAAAD